LENFYRISAAAAALGLGCDGKVVTNPRCFRPRQIYHLRLKSHHRKTSHRLMTNHRRKTNLRLYRLLR